MGEGLYFYLLAVFILADWQRRRQDGPADGLNGAVRSFMPLRVCRRAAGDTVVCHQRASALFRARASVWRVIRRLWLMMVLIVHGNGGEGLTADSYFSGLVIIGAGVGADNLRSLRLDFSALTVSTASEKWLSPLIGGLTGLITGATSVFVMPAVPFLQSLAWSKEELVQALGLSFTVSTVALAMGVVSPITRVRALALSLLSIVPALGRDVNGRRSGCELAPNSSGAASCYFCWCWVAN